MHLCSWEGCRSRTTETRLYSRGWLWAHGRAQRSSVDHGERAPMAQAPTGEAAEALLASSTVGWCRGVAAREVATLHSRLGRLASVNQMWRCIATR